MPFTCVFSVRLYGKTAAKGYNVGHLKLIAVVAVVRLDCNSFPISFLFSYSCFVPCLCNETHYSLYAPKGGREGRWTWKTTNVQFHVLLMDFEYRVSSV